MATPISGLGSVTLIGPAEITPAAARAPGASAPAGGASFGDTLANALSDAREAERTEESTMQRFAAGDPTVGIHEVMIAAEQASIAVRFAVTTTNRAVEAYRELMSTPL